ncbi:hypothetical protein KAR91_22660 [Candidatus Pacearchaeota archaeon]|nr:hypothetical protein [Candidatus Pacearchaeota archaeon]
MNVKEQITFFASTARTADSTSHQVLASKAGVFVIDVTADPASASVVFTIRGVDPISNQTWDILASAAINATGTTILRVDPGLTASANLIAKDVLPQAVDIFANHVDTDSITYSVSFLGVS